MAVRIPLPHPRPTPETRPYWDALREGRLRIQRCRSCDRAQLPPAPSCSGCGSGDVAWVTASGRGRLHSYVINHRPAPGYEGRGPYSTALVELEEGPIVVTNVVGCPQTPEALVLDMALRAVFESLVAGDDTTVVVRFTPTEGEPCASP